MQVMEIDLPEGLTLIDPDEATGLIPNHIANNHELNEWELTNVLQGERWAFGQMGSRRKRRFATCQDLLSIDFVHALHKHMFGDTWRWAGVFRSTEKNIGVDPALIPTNLRDLFEDVKTQIEFKSYLIDELAARFSHRLVAIHPFANGNGRLSRTFADLILVENGAPRFSWGAANLVNENDTRAAYLDALRAADGRNYQPLLDFVRS